MRRAQALAAVSWLALAWPLMASAQTVITPDVGGVRGLGTTASRAGAVTTIDGGTLAGANLFHSFSQFSLGAGETAQWVRTGGNPAAVSNVINRVTGGEVSRIAGTLDSTALPNASFWFINPAGIVFGAGARVNVPAAAWFSTAGELRFAGGGRFAIATPNGATLSIAAPESFGFVGGQGAIVLDGVRETFTPPAAALSLVASDVGVIGSSFVVRGLDLIAVGDGAAVVPLANPLAGAGEGAVEVRRSQIAVSPSGGATGALRIGGGTVILDAATLVSDTAVDTRGADVLVAADRLEVSNDAVLGAASRGPADGGDVVVLAGDIESNDGIFYTLSGAGGAGGTLSLNADTMTLNNTTLSSNATGAGRGGDIEVSAGDLLGVGLYAVSQAFADGVGGHVTISAATLELIESIGVTGASGAGAPGDVVLTGDKLSFSGGAYGSSPGAMSNSGNLTITAATSLETFGSILSASTQVDGRAGVISITSPDIYLQGTFIGADSFGEGGVGSVLIEGRDITLDETQIGAEALGQLGGAPGLIRIRASRDILFSLANISSSAGGAANGGSIVIEGRDITLEDTRINADTAGDGMAGQVAIKATRDFEMTNGAVSSDTGGAGNAGGVSLEAGSIHLSLSAAISSDSGGTGNAGDVTIKGGPILLEDGAKITSSALKGTGNSGTVTIDATSLTLADAVISSDTQTDGDAGAVTIRTGELLLAGQRRPFTYISSDTLGRGAAGGVTIDATSIVLRDQGYVSSNAIGDGPAGQVTIRTGSLLVRDGSFIASDTSGQGHAGDVTITANDFQLISGGPGEAITYVSSDGLNGGDAGNVVITAKTLRVDSSAFISSDTYDFGEAGDVTVKADTILLSNNGNIRSGTFSNGNAGNVTVAAKTLTLNSGAAVSSEAYEGSVGNAGFVTINADTLTVSSLARVSTSSSGEGDAGTVTVTAKDLLLDAGLISSAAQPEATGGSGSLFIRSDTTTIIGGGAISTVSNNPMRAGTIELTTGALLIDGDGSGITSENQAGDVAQGNAPGRGGDAGSISITADGVTIANGGGISTNAFAGAAGEIRIAIARPGLFILEGETSPGSIQTSSGAGKGGKITIIDPLAIISNGGSILALGELRGANVLIQSRYFINSSDRINTLAVDGDFRLETGLYDVSSGTVSRDLSVLDASKVLRGQCPAARSTGVVSQLITRPVGPYVREPGFDVLDRPAGDLAPRPGACP